MASHLSWTCPTTGDHPRIWVSTTYGPTATIPNLTTLRTRITGTHNSYWTQLLSYCASRVGYADSYFPTYDAEYTSAFALAYMLDNSKTSYASKAISIALHIAGKSLANNTAGRRYIQAMALVYDWCYDYLSSAQKTTLKNRIADYAKAFRQESCDEFLWGNDAGYVPYAMFGLIAILGDGALSGGADYLESTWNTWMDTCMDNMDDGAGLGFFPALRHFGDTDGGNFKGSGPTSYHHTNQQWFTRLFPAVETALDADWFTDEPWYTNWLDWQIWHWRCDGTWHLQYDGMQQAMTNFFSQSHAMQISQRATSDFTAACHWQYAKILDGAGYKIWGPYYQWPIFWLDTTKGEILSETTEPTIAVYGAASQMKEFAKCAKYVFRDGWGDTSTSVTISAPINFTGGHQHRDAGHFDLATQGECILTQHGYYDPDDTSPYKIPGDPQYTGHRYSFYKQIITKNVVRIVDTDEPTENYLDSYSLNNGAWTGSFGVYVADANITVTNQGNQLWPKNTGATNSEPNNLAQITGGAADVKWGDYSTVLATDYSAGVYAYVALDLTHFYYADKITHYHRHFLWVESGNIEGWSRPVLIVWDDLSTHQDGTAGAKTQVLQFQPRATPVGTADDWSVTIGTAQADFKILSPAAISWDNITDYEDLASVEFPYSDTSSAADDGVAGANYNRTEVWPTSGTATPQFLTVIFPRSTSDGSPPDVTLVDDATWFGVQFNTDGLIAKIRKDAAYAVSVTSDEAPAAPTGLSATPTGETTMTIDWDDNAEADLNHYELERSTWSGSAWGAWSVIDATLVASTYDDTSLTASTTYRYRVLAADDADNDSDYSDIKSATTDATPPVGGTGAGVAPWRRGGKFSKYYLNLG